MTWPFRYFDTVFPVPTTERNSWGSNGFLATINSCSTTDDSAYWLRKVALSPRPKRSGIAWPAQQHHVGRNAERAPCACQIPLQVAACHWGRRVIPGEFLRRID